MNDDLKRTADLLESHRPALDDERRAEVRRTIEARAAARRTPSVLVTLMLTLGLVMSLGGTGLAVSGLASDTTAVQAQYPNPAAGTAPSLSSPTTTAPDETADEDAAGEAGDEGRTGEGATGPDSADEQEDTLGETGVTPARELEATAGDGELPFTGLAAIPILILGVASLTGGLVLRRRTDDLS